jgi:hypothetical protein
MKARFNLQSPVKLESPMYSIAADNLWKRLSGTLRLGATAKGHALLHGEPSAGAVGVTKNAVRL